MHVVLMGLGTMRCWELADFIQWCLSSSQNNKSGEGQRIRAE